MVHFKIVERFAHDISQAQLIGNVCAQVVTVCTVETVSFQSQCLAVNVTVGISLQGDGKTLFGNTQCGIFGADMKVSLVNDGPFTVVLDSDEVVKVG